MARSFELNAILLHRTEVNPRLVILRVAPDGWELPDFEPGQYVTLGIPGSAPRLVGTGPEEVEPPPDELILRAYSIASSSKAREYLEFYVNLVQDGTFTPRLFALAEGDRLWLKGRIQGMFTLADVPDDNHIIMVATGTGLAPYMSMLRTHSEGDSGRRVAVLLGARQFPDLGYHQEMVELSRSRANLLYLPILSRPEGDWPGPVGRVQELWRQGYLVRVWGGIPSAHDTHIFLCGNPAMVADMLRLAEEAGFERHLRRDPGNVHVEEYW